MKKLFNSKNIGLALMASLFLFIVVKASDPYTVSGVQLNDSEFPRVQVAMKITGNITDLRAKNLQIEESGKENVGPLVLLPPHSKPTKVNLHILVDTSGRTFRQAELIRTNLKAMTQYLFESDMAEAIYISGFDGQEFFSNNLQGAINNLNSLAFSDGAIQAVDGFEKIKQEVSESNSTNHQKVLLIVNGSDFVSNSIEGGSDPKTLDATTAVKDNNYLAFVWGHPIKKIHAVKASNQMAELVDFSHLVPGGYLGGFGADLTSMVDLLKMQSDNDFVLQYYSAEGPGSFAGSRATIKIDGNSVHSIDYSNAPAPDSITIEHLPENEIVIGDVLPLEVDLTHFGSMVNALELKYRNEAGDFVAQPFIHQRSASGEESHKYSVDIPTDALWDDSITYNFSVETPYSSLENWSYIIPVNSYNGIVLTPTTLFDGEGNRTGVSWTWTVPSEIKAKSYDVYLGDDYLETTSNKYTEIPLGEGGSECDRYQVVQIKVTMPDGSKSESRPVGYFADPNTDGLITEWKGAELMDNCLEEKEITFTVLVKNTEGFNEDANLTLERGGLYLAKMISEDIWRKIEATPGKEGGHYSMIHYIMAFVDRDEYLAHGATGVPINESLVYKLISKANHTKDINQAYHDALAEIARRTMGSLDI